MNPEEVTMPTMLLTAIFLVSFSTLAFEVLLTRVFTIGQWNHLSFMVISIALFGFGASGTFLSIVDIRKNRRQTYPAPRALLAVLLCLFTAAAIVSFLSLNNMPLDYFRLAVEPVQCLYLLAAYLLLTLPFFFSGLIIAIGYTTMPHKAGLVYFASMAGSALGAVAPVPLLTLLDEGKLIIISALIPLIPAAFATLIPSSKKGSKIQHPWLWRTVVIAAGFGFLSFSIFFMTPAGKSLIQVKPSPFKALSQVLQFPKTRIVETKTGIRGRTEHVKTPYIRFAPGLSLKYTETLPDQQAVYSDGDNQFVLYELKEKDDRSFATAMLSYSGYFLAHQPENVLLIESGGGSAIACAVASGAGHIAIIEQNPDLANILRRQYRLPVIIGNPRGFLAQNDDRYDIIQIENWGSAMPGADALNQDHLFTLEAFGEYWNHLTATGVAIISRRLLLPPSDSLRLWSTAYEALKKNAVERPAAHLALLRNFDTFTLLVSKSQVDIRRVLEFCSRNNFDPVFLEKMQPDMANRFNVFDEPYHFQEINQLAAAYQSGRQNEFFRKYLLDVTPQSDSRPFPGKFLKWPKVISLYQSLGSRFYVLLMSGEIVILVILIEALIVAICLLVIPLILITRRIQKPNISQIVYFLGLGTGFMFVELYFIKSFILLVGDPVISFTMVVAGILLFTSLGGLWVQNKSGQDIRSAMAALIGILILTVVGYELLAAHILKVSATLRYFIAILFLLPVGFLMGLPFPLGMRHILNSPVQRAYAWSVNGCASVLSSVVAAQLAVSFGIPLIAAGAVLAYILALVATGKRTQG
jgi:MFS family permease